MKNSKRSLKVKMPKGKCLGGCNNDVPKPKGTWKWRWYCDDCRHKIKVRMPLPNSPRQPWDEG